MSGPPIPLESDSYHRRQSSLNSFSASVSGGEYGARFPYSSSTSSREGSDRFIGVRLRRTVTQQNPGTIIQGDHLQLASNQEIQKILRKQGEHSVLFGDMVAKVNRYNRIVKRLLLITEKAMYFFETDTFRLKRRIALADIESLSLSEFSDNFFAVNVPLEYDYLLISTRKTEIVTALNMAVQKGHGRELNVNFSNKFEFNVDRDSVRQVVFTEIADGISTKITKPW